MCEFALYIPLCFLVSCACLYCCVCQALEASKREIADLLRGLELDRRYRDTEEVRRVHAVSVPPQRALECVLSECRLPCAREACFPCCSVGLRVYVLPA